MGDVGPLATDAQAASQRRGQSENLTLLEDLLAWIESYAERRGAQRWRALEPTPLPATSVSEARRDAESLEDGSVNAHGSSATGKPDERSPSSWRRTR